MLKVKVKSLKEKDLKKVKSGQGEILSKEEFKALINYERTRSDRNGSFFSVVTFDAVNNGRKTLLPRINVISRAVRSVDRIGLYEKEQIAVLLPDTTKKGAEIFSKKTITELKSIQKDAVSFHIYTYPEDWLSGSDSIKGSKLDIKKSVEYIFTKQIPLWKRSLDILGSVFGLVILSPLFLLLSIYIKLVSPGPVFFNQVRIGYKRKEFNFWKFRTMKVNNNTSSHSDYYKKLISSNRPMEKLDDKKDPRIIFGGKVIRKSCIDELPQLWNVLKGDMSLVGPRPCIPYEAEEYLRWHTHRFDIVPGLTGLWQVSGKNKLSFRKMISLDINYSKNLSLLLDLKIILMTIPAIIIMVLEAAFKKINIKSEENERVESLL